MTLQSGNITALATSGLFFPTVGPYVPPVPVSGDVLETSPATLLSYYTINVITLQDPSGIAVWPAYLGSLPDGDEVPDNAGCFYDTYGWKDGRVSDGDTIEHYGVQVKIRSKEYEDGWAKIEQIAAAYDGINHYYPITVDGDSFILYNVSRYGSTMTLGVEPGTKRRWAFTANFLVSVKQVV